MRLCRRAAPKALTPGPRRRGAAPALGRSYGTDALTLAREKGLTEIVALIEARLDRTG